MNFVCQLYVYLYSVRVFTVCNFWSECCLLDCINRMIVITNVARVLHWFRPNSTLLLTILWNVLNVISVFTKLLLSEYVFCTFSDIVHLCVMVMCIRLLSYLSIVLKHRPIQNFLIRPPVYGSNGRSYKMLVMFFFISCFFHHAFSEVPRPIALKLGHMIGNWLNFIIQVQKFGGPSPKKIWGPKTCKISVDFIQPPTLIANISGTAQDI